MLPIDTPRQTVLIIYLLCSDAMWWHKTGSTSAQVMACCMKAPSHFQIQWLIIISKVQEHSFKGIIARNISAVLKDTTQIPPNDPAEYLLM